MANPSWSFRTLDSAYGDIFVPATFHVESHAQIRAQHRKEKVEGDVIWSEPKIKALDPVAWGMAKAVPQSMAKAINDKISYASPSCSCMAKQCWARVYVPTCPFVPISCGDFQKHSAAKICFQVWNRKNAKKKHQVHVERRQRSSKVGGRCLLCTVC